MEKKNMALLAIVTGTVIIAGLALSYQSETNVPTDPDGSIDVAYQELNTNGSRFHMNGTVFISIPGERTGKLQRVMVCLYGEDGRVIESRELDTFELPSDSSQVELITTEIPTYIVVDNPELRERGITSVTKRTDRTYRNPVPVSDIEFEYPRSNQVGVCP